MKIWLEKITRHPLLYILMAAFLMRLYFLINPGIVWWDSAVYIGLGKYVFSGGTVGIAEFFRPMLWPLILGLVWKIGINPHIFGIAFDLLLNLAAIYITYIIAEKIANKRVALFAAILLAISPSFIFYSSKVLTENLSIVLMLLAVYFLIEKKYSYAGLLAGISVLARYPQALLLPAFFVFIMLLEKSGLKEKIKNSAKTTLFFIIPVAGLFLYNLIAFGNIFYQLSKAQEAIAKAGMLLPEPWYFYFAAVAFECFFAVLFVYALWLSWKEKNTNLWLISTIFIFFFAYYSIVARKEIRYLIVALPMLYIPIGYVFENIYYRRLFRKHIVKYIVIALIALFAVSSFYSIKSENSRFYREPFPDVMDNFYGSPLIAGKTVISSSPNPIAYGNMKLVPMEPEVYYPYINMTADYYMFYTCDFFCTDQDCANTRRTFLNIINSTRTLVYKKELENCNYLMYEND